MRKAGVLLPIFSLPGKMGIGDLGEDAYEWIDMLAESKARLWQILPLNPVGYGNSPYQTYSSFAGDEIYISIEKLYEEMGLTLEVETIKSNKIDYESVRKLKQGYLQKAYKSFKETVDYEVFLKRAHWLDEYVEFITLKKQNKLKSWLKWTDFEADPEAMDYERFIQYVFDKQWHQLKDYANDNGVEIVGDLPIYLGHDSAEVYFHPQLFHLNKDGSPKVVAGVPPDYFSDKGQLWGNPLYNWVKVAEADYDLWVDRLAWNQSMFDVIRLDHFRAFDTFWVVDAKAKTAEIGEWHLGPDYAFFDKMFASIPNLNIVVEDLGDLRHEVLKLRDAFDLMGMKVIQFAIKNHEIEVNKSLDSNFISYTGTHDNPPIQAVIDKMTSKRKKELINKLPKYSKELYEIISYYNLSLNTDWAFLPIQDILGYGKEAQWNSPGTVGSPNWEWKLKDFHAVKEKMPVFKDMIIKSKRDN